MNDMLLILDRFRRILLPECNDRKSRAIQGTDVDNDSSINLNVVFSQLVGNREIVAKFDGFLQFFEQNIVQLFCTCKHCVEFCFQVFDFLPHLVLSLYITCGEFLVEFSVEFEHLRNVVVLHLSVDVLEGTVCGANRVLVGFEFGLDLKSKNLKIFLTSSSDFMLSFLNSFSLSVSVK